MVRLARDEQAMLEGKEGPARQKAMELLVKYAEGALKWERVGEWVEREPSLADAKFGERPSVDECAAVVVDADRLAGPGGVGAHDQGADGQAGPHGHGGPDRRARGRPRPR